MINNKFCQNTLKFLKKFSKHLILTICILVSGCLAYKYKDFIFELNKENIESFKFFIRNISSYNHAENKNKKKIFLQQDCDKILNNLQLAKSSFLNKNYDKTLDIFYKTLEHISEKNLINLIKLRIAAVYIEQKNFTKALDILKKIKDSPWENIVNIYQFECLQKNQQNK